MQSNLLFGSLPYVGITLVLLAAFRIAFDRITPYDDKQMRQAKNKAAKRTRMGAVIGYLIALTGSLVMSPQSYWIDVLMFALDGIIALVTFAIMYYAADLAILRRVNNAQEIEKGNMSVANAEFCSYMALGIIMSASFAGSDQSLLQGMASAVLFSVIGMLTVMIVYTIYTIGWSMRGCDLDAQICNGNRAAAIEAGSLLLGISLTLWFSIIGSFTGWVNDLKSYAIAAAISIVAVSSGRLAAGFFTRKLGRNGSSKHHGNTKKSWIIGIVSVVCGLAAGIGVYLMPI